MKKATEFDRVRQGAEKTVVAIERALSAFVTHTNRLHDVDPDVAAEFLMRDLADALARFIKQRTIENPANIRLTNALLDYRDHRFEDTL